MTDRQKLLELIEKLPKRDQDNFYRLHPAGVGAMSKAQVEFSLKSYSVLNDYRGRK